MTSIEEFLNAPDDADDYDKDENARRELKLAGRLLAMCKIFEEGKVADEGDDDEVYDGDDLECIYQRLERALLKSTDAYRATCSVMQSIIDKLRAVPIEKEDELRHVVTDIESAFRKQRPRNSS